jgi:hypothetical protein
MPDLEDRIVFESALTPQDINDRYHVLNGAIYGLASHGRFLGAFKPGNRSPDLRGLYLAGGSAHPGPGMPMVLMSGWIAADVLDKDGVAEINSGTRRSRTYEELSAHLEEQLTIALDALAVEAQRRDASDFRTILHGGAGQGGVYDLWRKLKAKLRGETFVKEHGRK